MANLRERGRTFRHRAAPLAAGVTITAERASDGDGTFSCTIEDVIVGRTVFASNATNGPRIEFGERDYYIKASLYLLGKTGGVVEPEEGDQFTETINGVDLKFEVMPTATGEPAWRYMDSGRTLLRVHVKRVTDWTGD